MNYNLLSLFLILALLGPISLSAQSTGDFSWSIYVDGERDPAYQQTAPLDSMQFIVDRVIAAQQEEGYYNASLDSLYLSENASPPVVDLYFHRGDVFLVERIVFAGLQYEREERLLDLMDTRRGRPLDPEILNSDIDRILRLYERSGYPFAKMRVGEFTTSTESGEMYITLHVEEGQRMRVNDLLLVGIRRTRKAYIEYLADIRQGEWLDRELDDMYRDIEAAQVFSRFDPIEVIRVTDDEIMLVINAEEDQPGVFDIVLGYQPPSDNTAASGFVGNGHLDLRSLFGMGRRISLRLNRLPGQISTLNAQYADPYFWGLPFSLEAGFDGIQQDSTYSQQIYKGALGYRLGNGFDAFATLKRETTRPGQAGIALINGIQRIPRSEVTFWGFSLRYMRLDRAMNPRAGFHMTTSLEGGRKKRSASTIDLNGDSTNTTIAVRQQRLEVITRLYRPLFDRSVFVLGTDTRILVSSEFDTSDLFRFGGAQSLRGYDEERFRGRIVHRSLLEMRYILDRNSYAYLFFDVGYIDRPATPDLEKEQGFFPGYGLGIQFESGIGLINTSLALSTQDNPSQAKVHVGLSLGL